MVKTKKYPAPHIEDDGYIYGVVSVDIEEIIERDLEGFLDLVSMRLTGTELLSDTNWTVVGHGIPDTVYLEVSGDPALAAENDEKIKKMVQEWEERLAKKRKILERHQRRKHGRNQ